jgi:hypothetical protein
VLFRSLHHNPKHGDRAAGAFRGAMEKINDGCETGRIAGKRRSKTGDLVLVDLAEFTANKIYFEKGMLGRSPAEPEQLFLNREDAINLCRAIGAGFDEGSRVSRQWSGDS